MFVYFQPNKKRGNFFMVFGGSNFECLCFEAMEGEGEGEKKERREELREEKRFKF